jgi:DNA-binding NtrC family response regulator
MIKVDVQNIAASNRDLSAMIDAAEFREDLYFRLKVVDLHLPQLRERKEDIPELVGFFLSELNQQMGMNIQGVDSQALELMLQYDWPGNVRELRNVVERAIIFCDDATIGVSHLPHNFLGPLQ